MKNLFLIYSSCLLILSCESTKTINETPIDSQCNSLLNKCATERSVDFCTFGYKWGKDNPFPNAGFEVSGPASGSVEISYKFQDAGLIFNTHSQNKVESKSFDKIISCAKQKIREAFAEWESKCDVKFIEKTNNDKSDITVIIADITQGGLGYPNFPNQPCSGLMVLNNTSYTCESIYSLSLHEIGHTLGLGHVASLNVMNPNKRFLNLQSGDIKGIESIYGKK
jgi:hypothetical protein